MDLRLNRPNVWRLSCACLLVVADLVEGRPRYHLDNHIDFDADLAYGRYTVSAYATGRSVWLTARGSAGAVGTAALSVALGTAPTAAWATSSRRGRAAEAPPTTPPTARESSAAAPS